MLSGYFPKITLPSGKSDIRKGDGLALIIDGVSMILDGFEGGEPTNRMQEWLMQHIEPNTMGTHVLDLAVISHAHGDHYGGVEQLANDNRFWIREIKCYDPDSLAFGVDSSANGRALKNDIASFKAFLNRMRAKKTTVTYIDKGSSFAVGDTTWKVWRKQPTHFTSLDQGQAYAFVNEGSLALHSPETGITYGGDGSDAVKEAIEKDGWKESGEAVEHHGNDKPESAAKATKAAGCVIMWQSCIERTGAGTTGWTAYGSRRVKQQGIPVWQQDVDIFIEADGGVITFRQGNKVISKPVPYHEWKNDGRGWRCGNYKDGAYSIGGKWYYFDADGYTITGMYKAEDGFNRYLHPDYKGAMQVGGWFQAANHQWYLADGYGRIMTGWHEVNGRWYYLDPEKDGQMAKDIIVPDWNGKHYVDGWGIMQKNCIIQHGGKQYYADGWGVIQTGWINTDGKWYCADETGAFRIGWYDDPDLGMRYLEPAMVINATRTIDGKVYRFDGYGRLLEDAADSIIGKLNEITASRRQFVLDIARLVREYAPEWGVKVYSPIIAQAILESGWGESTLAYKYNNYFGMKCGTLWKGKSVSMKTGEEYSPGSYTTISANFRVYDSMAEGVKGYFIFLFDGRTRYDNLKGVTDPRTYLQRIKDDGYATSSKYVDNCMNLVNTYSLTQFDGTQGPAGKYPRADIVSLAQSFVGTAEGGTIHHRIIDQYNAHRPLPRGYAVKYTDAWCATFCSYLAIACGYTAIIPVECGCPQWITLAKGMGSWVESDSYTPKPGDFILYDWQDSGSGDNTGTPDHIGIVEKVEGSAITVIEGNYNDSVKRRQITIGGRYIRGYVTPKYSD